MRLFALACDGLLHADAVEATGGGAGVVGENEFLSGYAGAGFNVGPSTEGEVRGCLKRVSVTRIRSDAEGEGRSGHDRRGKPDGGGVEDDAVVHEGADGDELGDSGDVDDIGDIGAETVVPAGPPWVGSPPPADHRRNLAKSFVPVEGMVAVI